MGYLSIAIVGLTVYFIYRTISPKWMTPKDSFPVTWRKILAEKVGYYNTLTKDQKVLFEFKVQEFLLNHKITGVGTSAEIEDKILVASSGVIPIFAFPTWKYKNLQEVLLYPNRFNEQFQTTGEHRNILGMVGTGYMEGKMILSKPALHHGFSNVSDKRNTAIHEFVHLIDKADGTIDGLPSLLLERPYTLPWIDLINKKIDEIYESKSDINPYGGTNRAEFFSVVSEYFFERPKLLAKKHPELYYVLEEIFDQDLDNRSFEKRRLDIGRNSPCPCDSGLKFKKCCSSTPFGRSE